MKPRYVVLGSDNLTPSETAKVFGLPLGECILVYDYEDIAGTATEGLILISEELQRDRLPPLRAPGWKRDEIAWRWAL